MQHLLKHLLIHKGINSEGLHGHHCESKEMLEITAMELLFGREDESIYYRVEHKDCVLISSNWKIIHGYIFNASRSDFDYDSLNEVKLYEFNTLEQSLIGFDKQKTK